MAVHDTYMTAHYQAEKYLAEQFITQSVQLVIGLAERPPG